MLGLDHGWWSEARVEIDHRAREARLRLEDLERLLISRVVPTWSWPRRAFNRRGLRCFLGGCVKTRSTNVIRFDPKYRRPHPLPTEICIAVNTSAAIVGMVRRPDAA